MNEKGKFENRKYQAVAAVPEKDSEIKHFKKQTKEKKNPNKGIKKSAVPGRILKGNKFLSRREKKKKERNSYNKQNTSVCSDV